MRAAGASGAAADDVAGGGCFATDASQGAPGLDLGPDLLADSSGVGCPSEEGSVDSDDRDIADGVATGQVAAFGVLFDRHARSVFRVCLRRIGGQQDAEDAMSTTFLQAWHICRRSVLVEGSLRPWLLAIAVNVVRNQQRSDRRRTAAWDRQAALTPQPIEPQMAVVAAMTTAKDAAVITAAIEDLPELERLVVELCLLEGLSAASVAAVLGIPAGTVRSRLSRARGRLQGLLHSDDIGEHSRRSGHHQGGRHPVAPASHEQTGRSW